MIELPETYVLAKQINETLAGKTIKNAVADSSPHKFAWYGSDPGGYGDKLRGKTISAAFPGTGYTCGGNTEILCDDMLLVISTPIRYHESGKKIPAKHQLWLEFEDGSSMTCTVQMWGSMFCFKASEDGLPENFKVKKSPTPLEDGFDEVYFESLLSGVKKSISAKAFLATEQRIPGLGNGVLHDILFNARVHPRTKLENLSDTVLYTMYRSVKETLLKMAERGGRDTERDLYWESGGYKTILSSKTLAAPCPVCLGSIIREAYLGGNIYYCPSCQQAVKA